MAKARKAAKTASTRRKSAKKKPASKGAAKKIVVKKKVTRKKAAKKAPVKKSAAVKKKPAKKIAPKKRPAAKTPVKTKAKRPQAKNAAAEKKKGAATPANVETLKDKLKSAVEDRARQAAEADRLRQKGEQLLHQLETARETISNLRGQLHSGAATDDLDLEPDIEEDDILDSEDPTYDFDGVGEDLNLLESRRRELDQARLEQELEQGGQTYWNICSKCGEGLEEFEFGGIKADRCEACGATLFERSEMELLLSVRPPGEILNRLRMLART